MKKIISIVLCLTFICLAFAGCSGPNADMTEENITQTVDVVEAALKDFDTEKLGKYVNSPTLSIIGKYANKHKQFQELGRAIFKNLEIDVKSINIDEKTVTVSVSNKDLTEVASSFVTSLNDQYTAFQLLSMLNDESFLDVNLAQLCEEIDKAEMINQPVEVTLTITPNGKNLIFTFDEKAENSVSGGALSEIKRIYSGS